MPRHVVSSKQINKIHMMFLEKPRTYCSNNCMIHLKKKLIVYVSSANWNNLFGFSLETTQYHLLLLCTATVDSIAAWWITDYCFWEKTTFFFLSRASRASLQGRRRVWKSRPSKGKSIYCVQKSKYSSQAFFLTWKQINNKNLETNLYQVKAKVSSFKA